MKYRTARQVVAIVGRPNVGKSTLFNRMLGRRAAIVEDFPGVTRDRHYGQASALGVPYMVIDTGGFEPTSTDDMLKLMRSQAELAIEEADVVIALFDGPSGLLPADEEITRMLQRSGKPIHYAVNKIDGGKQEILTAEFWALGVSMIWPISAQHGGGVYDLLEAVVEDLHVPDAEEEELLDKQVAVAVIGKPNVGKSTLINQMLGEERMLASEIAGTTRDSIDSTLILPPNSASTEFARLALEQARSLFQEHDPFETEEGVEGVEDNESPEDEQGLWLSSTASAADDDLQPLPVFDELDPEESFEEFDEEDTDELVEQRKILEELESRYEQAQQDRQYLLIDTAGIRRRKWIKTRLEKFSIVKSFKSIDRADVCLLLIDANEGVTDQDARLAGLIQAKGRACIILVNKWDKVVDKDSYTAGQMAQQIREDLNFVRYAPIIFISALTGQRVHRILQAVDKVMVNYRRRVSTGALNRFVDRFMARHQPPIHKGKRLQVYYSTQVTSGPPTILFSVNYRESLHFSYERFIHNQLRRQFDFEGVPIRFIFRDRKKRTRKR
jgi:GTPase